MKKKPPKSVPLLKLDLACGQRKEPGWTGVDRVQLDGVDRVHDLLVFPWPFAAQSCEALRASHFFEHVPGRLRGSFMDEAWRVLIPQGTFTVITPYFASMRSIQDFTHEWPPVCEASFLYFNKEWRNQNGLSHYPVQCDFDFSYGYSIEPGWAMRSQESRDFALRHYWHVALDLHVTLVRR